MEEPTLTVLPDVKATVDRLRTNIAKTIKGKNDAVDRVLVALLAGGHILIEDLPGLGKTTLAHCLAQSIDCAFSRIQFTSDMLPSDIIGVSIYDERVRAFTFKEGPIFANIVLADEINRTTPKTQSSLLEVMGRAKISVDGQTHHVVAPFMVIATQNPVDFEGTFPLPESQMDRFLIRMEMGYPAFNDELSLLQDGSRHYDDLDTETVATREEIIDLQAQTKEVYLEASVAEYILRIVEATRLSTEFRSGVSPRGSLALKSAAQARALMEGRKYVVPADVSELTIPVFAHRLTLKKTLSDPMEARRTVEGLLGQILEEIVAPT